MNSIHEAVVKIQHDNGSAVLCTVVKSEGSTPRHIGSKMLVYPDGHFIGTIGGGELESRVLQEAAESMLVRKPRLLHYNLSDPGRGDPGVCGGQVEVFVEPIMPAQKLVIIGAGHVGKAVAHLANWLGFYIIVSDDRPEFCNKEAIPDADEFHVCAMKDLPSLVDVDTRTHLVLTTRGSSVDVDGLPFLLRTPSPYIGIIGSKRRWETTRKELKDLGVTSQDLSRVRSPIGLELRAETPEEIAISILAEILMVRDQGTGRSMASSDSG